MTRGSATRPGVLPTPAGRTVLAVNKPSVSTSAGRRFSAVRPPVAPDQVTTEETTAEAAAREGAGESLQLGEIGATDVETARRFFDLRYWGAFMAAKYGKGHIKPGGSIVLTSGIATLRPRAGWALGASICGAMDALTRALSVELAPIRVNAVCPGVVRTDLWASMTASDREAMYQQIGAALPVGRVGEAHDVAHAYLFLMREGFCTGQSIVVDGGAVLV